MYLLFLGNAISQEGLTPFDGKVLAATAHDRHKCYKASGERSLTDAESVLTRLRHTAWLYNVTGPPRRRSREYVNGSFPGRLDGQGSPSQAVAIAGKDDL